MLFFDIFTRKIIRIQIKLLFKLIGISWLRFTQLLVVISLLDLPDDLAILNSSQHSSGALILLLLLPLLIRSISCTVPLGWEIEFRPNHSLLLLLLLLLARDGSGVLWWCHCCGVSDRLVDCDPPSLQSTPHTVTDSWLLYLLVWVCFMAACCGSVIYIVMAPTPPTPPLTLPPALLLHCPFVYSFLCYSVDDLFSVWLLFIRAIAEFGSWISCGCILIEFWSTLFLLLFSFLIATHTNEHTRALSPFHTLTLSSSHCTPLDRTDSQEENPSSHPPLNSN